MKWIMVVFCVLITAACQSDPDSWSEEGQEKEIAVLVRAGSGVRLTSEQVGYQLIVYDLQKKESGFYEINAASGSASQFKWKLLPGTYSGFCMMNAADQAVWEYSSAKAPEQIYVKLRKKEDKYVETEDYLLGHADFTVAEEGQDAVVFDLERKVAQLKVSIENIPEEMKDLAIHLSAVSEKMNLLGEYTEETRTVTKSAELAVAGSSVTSLLVFPTKGDGELTLSYKVGNISYTTPAHAVHALAANRITEIKAVFGSSSEEGNVDFETNTGDWEKLVRYEDDWYIDIPEVCDGSGNGVNLVENGSFEGENPEGIPSGWKLDAGGGDKKVVLVQDPVYEGQKAVRLEGKTYLYQDVSVTVGQCYQLRMYANSTSSDVKWRYWCTWMSGSSSLPSEELRSSSYHYATDGYSDVLENGIFRAPPGATKLRMEIRTYTAAATSGVGLYVDAVAVELVE